MVMECVRLDKWLWCTRNFKTRSLATDACKRSWITVNDMVSKPSREIRVGDLLGIRKGPIKQKVRVLQLLDKRVSASKVCEFMEDLTPDAEYERAKIHFSKVKVGQISSTTKGRPSKKQRRDLEEFLFGKNKEF